MGDHPEADAQEVENGTHPLGVAAGKVVVDRDDVDAPAGQRVEDRRHRPDEGLALAGLHLRDAPLVQDGRADQLDIELAHGQRPLHGLAGHGEDFGQRVVQRFLEGRVLARAALLAELASALGLRVGQFLFGRFARGRQRPDLVADLGELGTDLILGECLELGLEGVRLIDQGLDASDFTVIGVDKTGEESHGTRSIGRERGGARRRGPTPRVRHSELRLLRGATARPGTAQSSAFRAPTAIRGLQRRFPALVSA